ncbi:HTTM domain-containing protein [Mucilaginibacter sp. JRF]|uniref:HTTM domain-containing protein n=1 Tax=Mucilaginibacter sp. JRF TaxID=2780088 RepID=UPI00187E98F1|nr:HTTM domain-containing protein [Mucilaginibacter sp. JRF]MBE9583083.1 HTTM domain-containing protein [Mucilaginibacter sp. JRF]
MFKVFDRLQRQVSIAPLVSFRILFGLMMLAGTIRFWVNGWITSQYIAPKFYFTYIGFDWVRPLGDTGMHLLFGAIALSSFFLAVGFLYRLSASVFFMAFTYVELIDVTNYLNHYYFISLVAFMLIWLPAGRSWSVDTLIWPQLKRDSVPLWTIGIIRLQMGIVYFFAGIAKLNADWMLQAMPMKIWLPAKSHLPIVGELMYKEWIAYLFSWFGAVYDLSIAFLLINRRTRRLAYLFVLIFHTATAIFFPGIGMFPYVMMVGSTIFFSADEHRYILLKIKRLFGFHDDKRNRNTTYRFNNAVIPWMSAGLLLYFFLQIVVPLRYLLYPGRLFWYEEGYRFSWRVMLMEKSGNTFFRVVEPGTGKTYEVNNNAWLTPLQDKMMSTQPDMMLRYAHYLAKVYTARGIKNPEVYAEAYVTLNGERSKPYINTTVNLAVQPLSWQHYTWVLPYTKHEK